MAKCLMYVGDSPQDLQYAAAFYELCGAIRDVLCHADISGPPHLQRYATTADKALSASWRQDHDTRQADEPPLRHDA